MLEVRNYRKENATKNTLDFLVHQQIRRPGQPPIGDTMQQVFTEAFKLIRTSWPLTLEMVMADLTYRKVVIRDDVDESTLLALQSLAGWFGKSAKVQRLFDLVEEESGA